MPNHLIHLMISFRKTISNLGTGANFTYTDEFKRKGILFKCNTTQFGSKRHLFSELIPFLDYLPLILEANIIKIYYVKRNSEVGLLEIYVFKREKPKTRTLQSSICTCTYSTDSFFTHMILLLLFFPIDRSTSFSIPHRLFTNIVTLQ